MDKHCSGFKEDGSACKGWKLENSEFCFMHGDKEAVRAAGKKGGSVVRWKGLDDVLGMVRGPLGAAALFEQIANKVLTGELPPSVASAATLALNGMVRAYVAASSTQKGAKDLDSPVHLVHDEHPAHYELVWDFQKEELEARKVDDDDEDPVDTSETA